ncbi:MAG: DUF4623 domain-containing protein [Verrucomicrobiota bacterium]
MSTTLLARRHFVVLFFLISFLGWVRSGESQTNEFRGYWVDAFHSGFMTSSQVTTLVNDARAGNFNALVVEVRKRGDAYYNSHFEPKATDVSPQSFDPLADLIAKAHDTSGGKPRLEVHAWLVTYHIWNPSTANGVPPQASHPYNLHPDWLMKDVNGETYIGGNYTFDQSHPKAQEHTFNVALDIVTNYDVDGINFDYIRYNDVTEGYNDVSVQRFNTLFGRSGQPLPSDAAWKQFRRDQISNLLRKVYLHTIAIKPQVKISADTICFAPGVTNLSQWFSSSAAWNSVLQDWRGWMEEGILDYTIPMAYFREHTVNSNDWAAWSIFAKDFQYNRQAILGPGVYLNSISNSISQMRSTRNLTAAGNAARGVNLYSYAVVSKDGESRATFQNALTNGGTTIYDPIAPGMFNQKATIPLLPWKTTPTNGHLKGFIFGDSPTNALDGVVVTITGPSARIRTNDATGFYGFVELAPGAYPVTVSFPGYISVFTNVTISAGIVATLDLTLVTQGPPGILAGPQSVSAYLGEAASFTVSANGPGPLTNQWRHGETNLPGETGTTLAFTQVSTNDAGDYDVIIANSFGSVTSAVATLTVIVPPPNLRLIPLWQLAPGSRPYLTTGSTERGMTFNPATGRLLLVSRAGTPQIYVLNSTNGADLHTLNLGTGIISGGTFTLSMIGAAEDGAIYVGNLTTDGAATPFKIYRWANDNPSTIPTVAFSGNPTPGNPQRWGDTMDVRGAGNATQILLGSRNGTNAALFSTANGTTFTAAAINVDTVPGAFGLGIAFGEGDTFWGKASAQPLLKISFNAALGTGQVLQTNGVPTVANSIGPIGFSSLLQVVAGIAIETPDNLKVFDVFTNATVGLAETETFATDNDNLNQTGSVDFGGDRVFALDSNNGMIALRILPPPVLRFDSVALLPDRMLRLRLSGATGVYALEGTLDFTNWLPIGSATNTNGWVEFLQTTTNFPARFYRARPVQ